MCSKGDYLINLEAYEASTASCAVRSAESRAASAGAGTNTASAAEGAQILVSWYSDEASRIVTWGRFREGSGKVQ